MGFACLGKGHIQDKIHIVGEYQFLKKLNRDFAFSYLPQVYGYGEVEIRDTYKAAMFIGEWLNDYYEFQRASSGLGPP